ncbi:MAG: VOC family protein [Marinoscillum sp.]
MKSFVQLIISCLLTSIFHPLLSQNTMNINAKGLRTTIYKVDDLNTATAWYTKAFGVSPYFNEPFYVGFNIAGYELGLLPEKTATPKTTNILSYWAVDDITDAYDIMVTNGATELEAPKDVGEGVMVALVKDPWQNVIGLIYNPYFKLQHPENTVLEWAPFTLKENVSTEYFYAISARLEKEFLIHQPGFIKRELLKQNDDAFVDLIYWANEEAAKTAFERFNEYEIANKYFELLILDELNPVRHYQLTHN